MESWNGLKLAARCGRAAAGEQGTVVYELTAGLSLENVGLSDLFYVVHRELAAREAALTTSAEEEPAMLREQGIEVIRPRRDAPPRTTSR